MAGRIASLDKLQTRKRCLLLEAEVHRAQMTQDWGRIKTAVHQAKGMARTAKPWLTAAGMAIAGFSAYRSMRAARGQKGSFFSKLLGGASSLTSIFRFLLRLRPH
jgi:hypothetical protein